MAITWIATDTVASALRITRPTRRVMRMSMTGAVASVNHGTVMSR